jgi:serine/threonine protein kinase
LRALSLLRQLVLALAYAHQLGIVHRDLKPANIIVQALPGYEHVKVLDFGMVKLLPGSYLDRGEQLTRIGFTFGTPAYMSPEHAMGGDVDARSDLYSVGVLLFELLTGEKPFDGEIQDILRHHLATPVPRIDQRRPELADLPELQQIVERAMAKERDQRFASASELLAAFDALLMSGLLADDDDVEEPLDGDEESDRASMGPKVREALESAASALSSYARSSRELWRDNASPQLVRARRELRALAARLGPKLRGLSQAAWSRLQPQLLSAGQRISRLAVDAKQKLDNARQSRPRLPADAEPAQFADATVVDMPAFDSERAASEQRAGEGPERAPSGSEPDTRADATARTVAAAEAVSAAGVSAPAAVTAPARRAAAGQPDEERLAQLPEATAAAHSAEPLVLEREPAKTKDG